MKKLKVAITCAVLSLSAFAHAEIPANDLANKTFSGRDEYSPVKLKINADLSWSLQRVGQSATETGSKVVTTVGYGGAGTFVVLMDKDNDSPIMSLGTKAATIGDLETLEYDDLKLKLDK